MSKLQEVTTRFNQALLQYEQGKLSRHYIFELGNPSDVLLAANFPNL